MIEMSENKESYGDTNITVTINFDHLPKSIGTLNRGKRWYQPDRDTKEILSYVKKQIGEGAGSVILDGYLPPWGWLEVGAYLRVNFVNLVDRTEYRAQNGFSCVLPHVSGYVDV